MLIDPHSAVAVAAARAELARDAARRRWSRWPPRIRRNSPTRSSARPASARRCRRARRDHRDGRERITRPAQRSRRGRALRARACAARAAQLRSGMTVRLATLANGLRIVTDRIDTVETVSLGVWVAVGTRHEPAADQRRRAFPRAHGVQGHRAALGARASPRRSRRSAATSTPIPRARAPPITPRC